MENMVISTDQQGVRVFEGERPVPASDGACSVCHNLRVTGGGVPVYAQGGATVAVSGRRTVACDRRGHHTYIITQEDDGSLWTEGRVDDAGRYTALDKRLGECGSTVSGCAAAGDFLVLLTAAGKLLYARWNSRALRYDFLGERPRLPGFSAEASGKLAFKGTVRSTVFRNGTDDLRGGLDSESTRRVDEAVKQGHNEAVTSAHAAGYWTGPVTVRLAMRLWDGSLAQISEAVRVDNAGTARPDRVMLPLVWDSGKKLFTGTGEAVVGAEGYRIAVRLESAIPTAWQDVAEGIEVWISREQDTIAAGRECALATYTDTSGNYLAATLPVKSAEETEEGLAKAPSGLMYFAAGGKMPAEICRTAETEYNDKVTRYAGTEVYSDGVGAILGYGGFLYTARGSGVATSMRGNPFVTRCATTTVGGEVTAMWPRLNGGGAFTRQYIYLATPNGVAALTHKEDGTHTNCRMLSSERVESVRMGVAAPDGVYAVSSAGNLLRLRDSQSEVLIRGLTGTRAVCWSNLHGELWLSGGAGKGSVVLSDPGARKGFTSSFGFSERLDSLYPCLVSATSDNGVTEISSPDCGGSTCGDAAYTVELDSQPMGEDCTGRLCVELEGEPVDVSMVLRGSTARLPDSGMFSVLALDASLRSARDARAWLPLNILRNYSGKHSLPQRWRLEMKGRFNRVLRLGLWVPQRYV